MHRDWVKKVSEVPKIPQFEFTFSDQLSEYDPDMVCGMVASNLISKISETVTKECLESISTFNNDPLDTILLRIIADQRVEVSAKMLQTSSDNFIQLIEDIRDSIYDSSFNDIYVYDIGLFKTLAEDTFLQYPEVKRNDYYQTIQSSSKLKYWHESMGEVFKNYFSDKYVNELTNILIHCLIDEQKPIMVNIIHQLAEKINQENDSESKELIEEFDRLNTDAEFLTEITGIEHKIIVDQNGNPIGIKSIDEIQEEEESQISKPKKFSTSKLKKTKRKKIKKSRKRNRK